MLDSMTDNIKKSPEMNKYTKNFTKSSFFTIFTVILLHKSDKIVVPLLKQKSSLYVQSLNRDSTVIKYNRAKMAK